LECSRKRLWAKVQSDHILSNWVQYLEGFKNKRKAKAINIILENDSDDNGYESENEASKSHEYNFILMIMVDDISNSMYVEAIIVSNNITNSSIIEVLRMIVESKRPRCKLQPWRAIKHRLQIYGDNQATTSKFINGGQQSDPKSSLEITKAPSLPSMS
jgi:hypothetical protein